MITVSIDDSSSLGRGVLEQPTLVIVNMPVNIEGWFVVRDKTPDLEAAPMGKIVPSMRSWRWRVS